MSKSAPPELPPSRRRDARERALELLYEAEMKSLTVAELLPDLPMAPDAYAEAIVRGVDIHRDAHDAIIRGLLRIDWSFERLPVLDRLLLRMGCEELAHQPGTPAAVILDEIVELAKMFCAEDSSKFVNGVLAMAATGLRPLEKTRTKSRPKRPAPEPPPQPEQIDATP